jgi:hypothetical protein
MAARPPGNDSGARWAADGRRGAALIPAPEFLAMKAPDAAPPVVTVEAPAAHVRLVTLRRPEARNAVNGAVALALHRIVHEIEADPDAWVVVLTGAGGQAFCSGADLKEVSGGRLESLWTPDGGFAGFVRAPRSKVWIAAIDGLALAGGFEIALACDLIVASDDAAFGLPEVTRGLIAAAGGLYRLPRSLPRALAASVSPRIVPWHLGWSTASYRRIGRSPKRWLSRIPSPRTRRSLCARASRSRAWRSSSTKGR